MKIETYLLLHLRELIDNWKYVDGIIFLIILLMYVGFTDPCDRCMVNAQGSSEIMSCKDAFNIRVNLDSYVADSLEKFNKTYTEINKMPLISS